MREERPSIHDLVTAVQDFLDEQVRPALEGRLAFHTRVAANALGIVARELEAGAELQEDERRGLQQLLAGLESNTTQPNPDTQSVRELNQQLATAIRDGAIESAEPALLDHLRQVVDRKLAIDNPKYRPVDG